MKCLKFISSLYLLLTLLLTSCSTEEVPAVEENKACLLSVSLRADNNKEQLIEDVYGTIVGDSLVCFHVPYICNNKNFFIEIDALGEVLLDGVQYDRDKTYDFSHPIYLEIRNRETSKKYIVYVHTFTGLPVMWIETEGRAEITSKEDYLPAHMLLREDIALGAKNNTIEADL